MFFSSEFICKCIDYEIAKEKGEHKHKTIIFDTRNVLRLALVVMSFVLLFSLTPRLANATVNPTQQDVDVFVRSIYFAEQRPSGELNVAIIYDFSAQTSLESAKNIDASIKSYNGFKDISLRPFLIDVNSIDPKMLDNYDVFYIADDLTGHYEDLKKILSHGFVISRDKACLDKYLCTLYARSHIFVELDVNQDLARSKKSAVRSSFVDLIPKK